MASIAGAGTPLVPDVGRARRLTWLALWLLVVTVAVGLGWDRAWHATHVFDSFYSPPHLFIYLMTLATAFLVASMTAHARVRAAFGSGLRVPPLPFVLPGPLVLLGGGLATLALAGVLDDLWHSTFGLDETGWSFPHAMLGRGWLLAVLGLVSCRLALARSQPISWPARLFLGWLLLAFSIGPFLGPLHTNRSPELVAAIARLPALAVQPAWQHTFRIYESWHLARTSPLVIPLGALWAGAALALLRRLEPRGALLLVLAALWSLIELTSGVGFVRRLDPLEPVAAVPPAAWLPLPLLPAALAYLLGRRLGLAEGLASAGAGLVFGLLLSVMATPNELALALLAAPLAVVGMALGRLTYGLLERPARPAAWAFVATVGLAWPFATGLVDLALRMATP